MKHRSRLFLYGGEGVASVRRKSERRLCPRPFFSFEDIARSACVMQPLRSEGVIARQGTESLS